MKWQVDETASQWNGKLMKLQVNEMASRWNCKSMKWQVDEVASRRNHLPPQLLQQDVVVARMDHPSLSFMAPFWKVDQWKVKSVIFKKTPEGESVFIRSDEKSGCSVVLSTWHFVNLTFCQFDILSTRLFVYLALCQLDILSTRMFVNLTFLNQSFRQLTFCQLINQNFFSIRHFIIKLVLKWDFLSTWHFVNLTFCQLDILSTWHFVNLTFCQLDILCFVNYTVCQFGILWTRMFMNLTFINQTFCWLTFSQLVFLSAGILPINQQYILSASQ
jgi:hypothetical protein